MARNELLSYPSWPPEEWQTGDGGIAGGGGGTGREDVVNTILYHQYVLTNHDENNNRWYHYYSLLHAYYVSELRDITPGFFKTNTHFGEEKTEVLTAHRWQS